MSLFGLLDAFSRISKAFFYFIRHMRFPTLVVLSCFLLNACTEPDTTEPIIEILSSSPETAPGMVCGEMEELVITLTSTDTFLVQFTVSDDSELSQYKLDLHQNFDCHGHASKVETTDWYVLDIVDLQGSEQTLELEIPVPLNVTTGDYHFSIQATDVSGNNAESVIYALNVTNATDTEVPVLTVNTPSNSTFSVLKGNPINFQGAITDNLPLGSGSNGKVEVRYWSTSNQTVIDLYSENFENSVGTTYNFDFDVTVPLTTTDGTYIFEVRSFDAVNNASNTVQFTVEVD